MAHRNRVRVAQLSDSDNVGWCWVASAKFSGVSRIAGFWVQSRAQGGWGPGFKPGLNHTFPAGRRFGRNLAPPGSLRDFLDPPEPRLRCAIFVHRTLSTVRPPSCGRNSPFTGFWGGLRNSEKFRGRPGPKTGPTRRKGGFSRSWGPFCAKRPPTKFDRVVNADPVDPVWGPMWRPWGPRRGRRGGWWGPFCRLGTDFVG